MWYMILGHTPTRWCIMMSPWSMVFHGRRTRYRRWTLRTSDVSWRRNHLVPCRESSGIWSPSLFCKGAVLGRHMADGGTTWGMATKLEEFCKIQYEHIPIGSMYAIYGNIYHQYTPNVNIYTIHGSYGKWTSMKYVWSFNVQMDDIEISMSRWQDGLKFQCRKFNVTCLPMFCWGMLGWLGWESQRVLSTARQQQGNTTLLWKTMDFFFIANQDLFLPLNTWAVNLVKCSPTHLSTGSTTCF